jgi:signal transduction histidine kinase
MKRRVVWLQLLIGWLPIGALFAALIVSAHRAQWHTAALVALRMIVAGAVLGLGVQRVTEKLPWPHPVRARFVAAHLAFAAIYAVAWVLLNSAMESLLHARVLLVVGYGVVSFLLLGVWLYVTIAVVSYTAASTERAARAEANAARAQLAALRSQLHPHFLFNALHTVVQLIPQDPKLAAQAAEQLAGLLRGTIEEDRDLVPVLEECAFVERYLDLERIRFGDRLRVLMDVSAEAGGASIPSFAVQTLVENAVRHGAAPRIEPTDITISARVAKGTLTIVVHDTGAGASADELNVSTGTGLKRLRDRLAVLYGGEARLDLSSENGSGVSASLIIPYALADA